MNKTLKPCPFCGGEAELIECDYGMYNTGYAVYCIGDCRAKLGVTGRLGEAYEWTPVFDTEAEAIAAWNTRATHGTLTAEQVRKAIFIGGVWDEDSGAFYVSRTDMQAIADELNATLGAGECRSTTPDDAWCFACSECGKSFPRNELHLANNHGEINYCPNCGAKVKHG